MSDPLHDPRFPDRPQTQDFWRLSEIVLYLDGALEDTTFEEVVNRYIDLPSLEYMAIARAKRFIEKLFFFVSDLPEPGTGVTAGFMNGFIAGVLFQERGGHREG